MWLSRRAVAEYTCLLELVWCRRQAPLVIDVADIALLNNTSISIGFVRHERMIEHAFLERARRLLASEVDAMRTAWHWQRAENSELRILAESGVRSVPLSHFDALIVSIAGDLWTPCAQVLVNTIESPGSAFRQLGQELVWSRIRFLVDNGQLEGNDEFGPLHTSLVRRPPRSRRRGR